MSDEPMPRAPASISRRTRSRMVSSWAGVGRPSSRPTTCSRMVPVPTNEATFGATPRRSRRRRYSAERRPRDVEPEVPLHRPAAELHGLAPRAVGLALPEDLGRHALSDVALRAGVGQQVVRRPREHVDEAGGDGEAGRVDDRAAGGAGEITHRLDAVAAKAEVGPSRRPARAVVDGAALDQHVERGRLQRRRVDGGQQGAAGDRGGRVAWGLRGEGSRGREC